MSSRKSDHHSEKSSKQANSNLDANEVQDMIKNVDMREVQQALKNVDMNEIQNALKNVDFRQLAFIINLINSLSKNKK
ncbi:hypothetical protein CPAST_c29050 [Clostridium pasteurianum DSM 525 = ATCC 6013]|jgi:hypothetical protein|uniref:Uncharacterized protein n=1 Tax=Clostridium pasteurianum DSM 525 = ATCC 6013 TaxID=1262449 RepID=A0A0H3J4X5_CLOPA|nr:hypothetical protein [Clostridium pasteurianum]AJA48971.1 hypothetical protein CPAST_c29050 [Clostridium pasteurianum DSM 525 = ATCC 6013]AJA52959.1 hypothetical protein CLPA_c29050 [Clostridium pasteurianum DSM 525 = ATCC 6013]AOZ76178.1 hypothetical protein AQ983_14120 [Clostridium pasteurianum DSM 525 = ATCC 6013]AOZ79974.1 hypothetical protein AQ984_14115 [Clostridium pasteurianum]ELP60267.1 hypothetical protein F502_06507 [Clostridium pasteurianum DSM 525 = ATCC 6013]